MAQFTKQAIIKTFVDLLNETTLDKITVQDIVSKCGINRNTFYYYFEDKYDLVKKMFESEIENGIDKANITTNWRESFNKVTKFALENKKAIYHVYNSLNKNEVENYLYRIVENLMNVFINYLLVNTHVSDSDKQFLIEYNKYALVGLFLNWIQSGMKDDPNIFTEKTENLFIRNITKIVDLYK